MKRIQITLLLFSLYNFVFAQDANKALDLFIKGRYSESALEYEKTIPLYEKKYSKTNIYLYTDFIVTTAETFNAAGNYPKAEEYYLKAKDLIDINYKKNPSKLKDKYVNKYTYLLNDLAFFYSNTVRYTEAEVLYKKILEINRPTHPEYGNYLDNLVDFYVFIGKYNLAEPYFKQSLEIGNRRIKDVKSSDNYFKLAISYEKMGKFSEAESIYKQAYDNPRGYSGSESLKTLEHLSNVYFQMGDYVNAEVYLKKLLIVLNKFKFFENGPYDQGKLQQYALINEKLGNYSISETYLKKVIDLRKKSVGEKNPLYATTLSLLADLYLDLGNYGNAEPILKQALEIQKECLFETHPSYATTLNKLAVLYTKLEKYDLAESYYNKALNIRIKSFGPDHPTNAIPITNLAILNEKIGKIDQAEELYKHALNITEKDLGKNHINYALVEECYASLLIKRGKFDKAEELLKHVIEIKLKTFGENHPLYTNSLINLAKLYISKTDYSDADPLVRHANSNINNQIHKNFEFLSESEKEKFIESIYSDFELFQSFSYDYKESNPEIVGLVYNNELSHKGMILQNSLKIRKIIQSSNDTVLLDKYHHYSDINNKLARLYVLNAQKEEIEQVEQEENSTEKELNELLQKLPDYKNLSNSNVTCWENVQSKLLSNEIAVEFITFNKFKNGEYLNDSTIYCALLLRKDFKYPKMIYLCNESQLNQVLLSSSGNSTEINSLYDSRGIKFIKSYSTNQLNNIKLKSLLWDPISKEIKGINKAYIAPIGLLNKLSFAALPVGDDKCLADILDINIVSTTANVITNKNQKLPETFALFGGINYDADTTEMIRNAKSFHQTDTLFIANRGIGEIANGNLYKENWNYLPGTKAEVEKINEQLERRGIKTYLSSGEQGSEEEFKNLSNTNPEVIHVATHGFFFDQPQKNETDLTQIDNNSNDNIFKNSENPMMRCGLLLAGCNKSWNNISLPSNIEDGVLSGYEVSQLNLSGVKLVVLSACQTGLGDIKGSEGVFGMQRAFKMAGVDYLIVSLWSVPDEQTSELMDLFYNSWLSGNKIQDAFRNAQKVMRSKYPPYYWAAFELIN